jgi:hypothetical protein
MIGPEHARATALSGRRMARAYGEILRPPVNSRARVANGLMPREVGNHSVFDTSFHCSENQPCYRLPTARVRARG